MVTARDTSGQRKASNRLAEQMLRLLDLLKQVEPLADDWDVMWVGPYFIPRRGVWHRSRFTLSRGHLYADLLLEAGWEGLCWRIESDEVEFQDMAPFASRSLDHDHWSEALAQLETRLRSAVRGFAAYNRRVARRIPPECRTGVIERRLTWPKGEDVAFPAEELERLQEAVARGAASPPLAEMTLHTYLDAVAVAYDAVFDTLRLLPAMQKYRRLADGRHGGLLDLASTDAAGFASWFHSSRWHGGHPWEILYGVPHGIMLSPSADLEGRGWRYRLWVGGETWRAHTVRMALALAAHDVPFAFVGWEEVRDALAGVDHVRVGPELGWLHYEEIVEIRPDSLAAIRWDPLHELGPISSDQLARVRSAERDDAPKG